MIANPKQRPEALAQFAETARTRKKKDDPGLVADEATMPIPTDPKAKDEAATKVLREGVSGTDQGADEAIDRLPDRIRDSGHRSSEGGDGFDESNHGESYDATTDPRTGRPPLPLTGARTEQADSSVLAARLGEGDEMEIEIDTGDDEVDIDVTLEEDEVLSKLGQSGVRPARMASPDNDDDDDDVEQA